MPAPKVELDAEIVSALTRVKDGDLGYQGYLARAIKECLKGLYEGDASAPERLQRTLNLPAHQAERMLPVSFASAEAATWVRAALQVAEIAEEVVKFSPRRPVAPVERRALEILREQDPGPLRVVEVRKRWRGDKPSMEALGLSLEHAHNHGAVVRLHVSGPGGPSFRITRLGLELLTRLEVGHQPSQAGSE